MRFVQRFNISQWSLLTCLLLAGCNTVNGNKTSPTDSLTATNLLSKPDSIVADTAAATDEEYSTLYITVADTGQEYAPLDSKMYALHNELHWPVDTANRYYNKQKKKIVVADNDDDEMYRGEYFPRRFPSENMSLEYYSTYTDKSTQTNIALVTGIYETKQSADSLLRILKPHASNAFVAEGRVFSGCMH